MENTEKIQSLREQLTKASLKFTEFYSAPVSELSKAASTQAFEYTFELAWKYCREVVKTNETEDFFNSPKGTFKVAGKLNILSVEEVEKWILYCDNCNLTVHMYRQDIADQIFNSLSTFAKDVESLIVALDKFRQALK